MSDPQPPEPPEPPRPAAARCYRHPDRETGVACTRCERHICPACMIPAAVGHHCPECVRGSRGPARDPRSRPRTVAGGAVAADPGLVTKALIGLNVVVYLAVVSVGDQLVTDLGMLGYAVDDARTPEWIGVAAGEWYRLLTAAFLHQQFWHVLLNMLGLWFLGGPLEAALGRARYLTLYVISALGGSALSYLLAAQNQISLGASGAIFGLFGATAVLLRRLRYSMQPIVLLLAVNLVFTFAWSGIAWQAHIGGLVTGAVVAYGMVHAPRERRTLIQAGTCAAVLLVIVVACAIRTSQLVT